MPSAGAHGVGKVNQRTPQLAVHVDQRSSGLSATRPDGAEAFATRARRELLVTGHKASKRPAAPGNDLTAQEAQIVRLAGEGFTNPEIGGQLFISTHTVEWHLRKVFTKLGITSRSQLRGSPLEWCRAQAAMTVVPPPWLLT
jgi:DNA-binding NarL/FixJ family response regulator